VALKMVVGILFYKFEMGLKENGEIEPEFKLKSSDITEEMKKQFSNQHEIENNIIKNIDLFSIYYNHTAGIMAAKANSDEIEQEESPKSASDNSINIHLKKTPYKVISHFHEIIEGFQYLTVTVFKLDDEMELYNQLLIFLSGQINLVLNQVKTANLEDNLIIDSIYSQINLEIKKVMYQMERLSNLTKLQKIALLYNGEERYKTLEILREGPISRKLLSKKIEEVVENPNMELILKSLVSLNIVRRDWAHGVQDRKVGIFWGDGEYVFLIKDVLLVRKPAEQLLAQMKKNKIIGEKYIEQSTQFFKNYNPFKNYRHESRLLAKTLLNPDIFDFLGFMKDKPMKKKKIPHIMSDFAESDMIISFLIDIGILALIKGTDDEDWLCVLSEIAPLAIFPEYLIDHIQSKMLKKNEKITDELKEERITTEIAAKALTLLENTYQEEILF
jgi:hypothetical protein